MSKLRLDRNDHRLLLICAALIVVCAVYVKYNYARAFPQASIKLELSKDQVTARAAEFLKAHGYNPAGYHNLTLFSPDTNAQFYLERELGLDQANKLMAAEVPVWKWRARWFQPPRKEEFAVELSPSGKLIGFDHTIDESAPGARLTIDEARARAEQFLKSQTSEPYKLIEEKQQARPNRLDYDFTWERQDFAAKDGKLRRSITVQGGEVGSYSFFLHVPEQWQRDFAQMRSRNDLYTQIALVFFVLLVLAALVVLVQALMHREIRWKPLLTLTLVVAGLNVISEWNSLPFFINGMPTSSPFWQSVSFGLLEGVGTGVFVFFYIILAAAPGDLLYFKRFPKLIPLRFSISTSALKTKDFFRSSVAGYALAAGHITFVTAFYVVGTKFGVWSPQDVPYSDMLGTWVPWLYPLTISLLAATSEEFWFRLFAIPLLLKTTKSRWVAVIVPAFIWGFLHANYPQEPAWIRGVEVGLIGIVAGLVLLRFGILATLIWHYTVDAVFIGMFLFQSGNLYFWVAGLLVAGLVLLPFSVSLVHYRRNKGFLEQPVPVEEPPEEETEEPAVAEQEQAAIETEAPARRRWPVAVLLATAAVLGGALLLPRHEFASFVQVRIDRGTAERLALDAARQSGLNPADWRHTTEFLSNIDTDALEYLREKVGAAKADEILRQRTLTGVWSTRLFRSLQKEEWRFFIDQNGKFIRSDLALDEKAPGANLTPEAARAIAEKYLSDQRRRRPRELSPGGFQRQQKRQPHRPHLRLGRHPFRRRRSQGADIAGGTGRQALHLPALHQAAGRMGPRLPPSAPLPLPVHRAAGSPGAAAAGAVREASGGPPPRGLREHALENLRNSRRSGSAVFHPFHNQRLAALLFRLQHGHTHRNLPRDGAGGADYRPGPGGSGSFCLGNRFPDIRRGGSRPPAAKPTVASERRSRGAGAGRSAGGRRKPGGADAGDSFVARRAPANRGRCTGARAGSGGSPLHADSALPDRGRRIVGPGLALPAPEKLPDPAAGPGPGRRHQRLANANSGALRAAGKAAAAGGALHLLENAISGRHKPAGRNLLGPIARASHNPIRAARPRNGRQRPPGSRASGRSGSPGDLVGAKEDRAGKLRSSGKPKADSNARLSAARTVRCLQPSTTAAKAPSCMAPVGFQPGVLAGVLRFAGRA